MSESIAEWAEAFAAAQAELPEVPKTKTADIPTKTGGKYSYRYADLSDVLAACRPVLNRHGLSISQSVTGDESSVAVTTRIFHVGGHVEEFGPTILPAGSDARGVGSAVTYARRYGLCAALGITPDEDDDGQAASHRAAPPPRRMDSELSMRLTNRLKAKALEIAGEKDAAMALFSAVVGDTPVIPDTVEVLEAEIVRRGGAG